MAPAGNLRKDIQVTLRQQTLTALAANIPEPTPHPTSNDPANLKQTSSTAALMLQSKPETHGNRTHRPATEDIKADTN